MGIPGLGVNFLVARIRFAIALRSGLSSHSIYLHATSVSEAKSEKSATKHPLQPSLSSGKSWLSGTSSKVGSGIVQWEVVQGVLRDACRSLKCLRLSWSAVIMRGATGCSLYFY